MSNRLTELDIQENLLSPKETDRILIPNRANFERAITPPDSDDECLDTDRPGYFQPEPMQTSASTTLQNDMDNNNFLAFPLPGNVFTDQDFDESNSLLLGSSSTGSSSLHLS